MRNTIHDENGRRVIAVDPKMIPLGATVEVRIGSETLDAIALDTGGAIKGTKIDVLFAKHSEAIEFGRKSVELRILDENIRPE